MSFVIRRFFLWANTGGNIGRQYQHPEITCRHAEVKRGKAFVTPVKPKATVPQRRNRGESEATEFLFFASSAPCILSGFCLFWFVFKEFGLNAMICYDVLMGRALGIDTTHQGNQRLHRLHLWVSPGGHGQKPFESFKSKLLHGLVMCSVWYVVVQESWFLVGRCSYLIVYI